jgi:hypothetical protein
MRADVGEGLQQRECHAAAVRPPTTAEQIAAPIIAALAGLIDVFADRGALLTTVRGPTYADRGP